MATAHLLTQEVADRVGHLQVRARRAVEGLRSGIHRSPHRGASVIFAEHRDYRPGDDLRLLDWRAYARNDRYTIKHFEQETALRAQLVLDQSASMQYDGGDPATHKADYAAALLGALGLVLLGQGDAVGALTFDGTLREQLPPRSRLEHLDQVLRLLATPPAAPTTTALRPVLAALVERVGTRGLVAIASDLLDTDAHALDPLSRLRAAGHDVLVFHVCHPHEVELPFDEPAHFEDLESDLQLDADPVLLREAYRKEFGQFIDDARRRCIAAGARYTLARTDRPIQQVLARALRTAGGS